MQPTANDIIQRIIIEVEKIVGFTYTGRDTNNIAYSIIINNQEYAWDMQEVSAFVHYENVPFVYDRQGAANKAVDMAIKGQGQAISEYNFIQYGTDSARFMSIAIHGGGLPFTTTDSNGNLNICDNTSEVGWCAFSSNNQIDANRVFVLHNSSNLASPPNDLTAIPDVDLRNDTGLVGYLLGSSIARGNGVQSIGSVEIQLVSVEEMFGVPSEYGLSLSPYLIPLNQNLPSVSYTIFTNTNFATRISDISTRLQNFQAGDYVFTAGPNPHGFIITGFGSADECQGSESGNSPITSTSVPYIVDLPGVQDGDPRPFYCLRLSQDYSDDESFFVLQYLHFIKIPDLWLIKFDRLYSAPIDFQSQV